MTLKEWKNSTYRADWEAFLSSPAGRAGVELLRTQSFPIMIPGEALETAAMRHAHHAGFYMCLHILENIHKASSTTVQEKVLSEWDWKAVAQEDNRQSA